MKNNILKPKLLLFISLFAFISVGVSQNENFNKKKKSIKPFYSIDANIGISTCMDAYYLSSIHGYGFQKKDAKLSYKSMVYGVNFAGGIELAHYLKVGLGLGYLFYKQTDNGFPFNYIVIPNSATTHGLPLFLYFRSDFLDKKTSPYLDFKIGNNFLVTKETVDIILYDGSVARDIGNFKLKNGLFLVSNIGVAFKVKNKTTLNLSVGYRYVSRGHDYLHSLLSLSGKEEYRKTGYITADHQFIVSFGVSF